MHIEISSEARAWMNGLAPELRAFYRQLGRELSNADLMLEIERAYGDRIFREVCVPRGLYEGACLLIAAAVAKDEDLIPTRAAGGAVDL